MQSIFVLKDTATTEIYTYCHTLSLHVALPILFIVRPSRSHGRGTPTPALSTRTARRLRGRSSNRPDGRDADPGEQIQSRRGQSEGPVRARSTHAWNGEAARSEEHTSELQSIMRNSYAAVGLTKKIQQKN